MLYLEFCLVNRFDIFAPRGVAAGRQEAGRNGIVGQPNRQGV